MPSAARACREVYLDALAGRLPPQTKTADPFSALPRGCCRRVGKIKVESLIG
jgi:hypothetical protein